jgi:hypothetical protein
MKSQGLSRTCVVVVRQTSTVGSRPASRRAALLDELCRDLGYCNDLPAESLAGAGCAEEIIDSVLVAEGLDPATCDRATRATLAKVVDDWLFDPQGRGVQSGLPR